MTTLKEYKAMMEGATDAPWVHSRYCETAICTENDRGICSTGGYTDNTIDSRKLSLENLSNAQFIAASRNIAPELIRVIELAEEALLAVNEKSHFVPAIVQEVLSEIRKLKGE